MSGRAADLIRRAEAANQAKDFGLAAELATQAAIADSASWRAWRLLGVYREKLSDYAASIDAYERAMRLAPNDPSLARDVARLASLLNQSALAERFLLRALDQDPTSLETINDLACAYCAQMRFGDAIELLKASLTDHSGSAMLWNTLGCVLFESGQAQQSLVFFDEAIRLQPDFQSAHYNRANARKAVADFDGALEDCEQAITLGADSVATSAMYRYARAILLLTAGSLPEGWAAYAVRNDPAYPEFVRHELSGTPWRAGEPLAGRRVLAVGEQGLGDEVLFANILDDLQAEIGQGGRLIVAVEPRLVPLIQRSFPSARVIPYQTRWEGGRPVRSVPDAPANAYDTWAPMGDFLAQYRPAVSTFPGVGAYLTPDDSRVEAWREALARLGPQPKVGVIRRSLLITSQRVKFYPAMALWEPVFNAPGITFVNLQVGETESELRAIEAGSGATLHAPAGLDLKSDLDGIAALSRALDLVIGPATATTNIAAAVGARTWFLTTPDGWPRLGTEAFPWYPGARGFSGTQSYDWPGVMNEVAAALRSEFPG